jgi:hypothetical protein
LMCEVKNRHTESVCHQMPSRYDGESWPERSLSSHLPENCGSCFLTRTTTRHDYLNWPDDSRPGTCILFPVQVQTRVNEATMIHKT